MKAYLWANLVYMSVRAMGEMARVYEQNSPANLFVFTMTVIVWTWTVTLLFG